MADSVSQQFHAELERRRQRTERLLKRELQLEGVPERLLAAMRYAVLGGGKRLRPLLAYAAAEAVGGDYQSADIPACAVELIHAYSLIHDDLPAMDDDVLRRGKPTCHVAFDEATAILAGDALQTRAFELLMTSPALGCGDRIRLQMLAELARASGARGMVGGQALDIAAEGQWLDEDELRTMHRMKTGALIRGAVLLGALSSNVAGREHLTLLGRFAELAGLAFQIRDDILDVETATEVSGKQQGKDARLNKPTYTSLLGLQSAHQRLREVSQAALAELAPLGDPADMLRGLLAFIVERQA